MNHEKISSHEQTSEFSGSHEQNIPEFNPEQAKNRFMIDKVKNGIKDAYGDRISEEKLNELPDRIQFFNRPSELDYLSEDKQFAVCFADGFFDKDSGNIYIRKTPNENMTMWNTMHESLHFLSNNGMHQENKDVKFTRAINEGMTERLTTIAMQKMGIDIPDSKRTYLAEMAITDNLTDTFGEKMMMDAYFGDHSDQLEKAFNARGGNYDQYLEKVKEYTEAENDISFSDAQREAMRKKLMLKPKFSQKITNFLAIFTRRHK